MGNEFAVCCGVDVGKWAHHVVAIDTETGEVLFDSKVDQSEREIRAALSPLCAAGKVRVVVDEPGPMSRLLFAVAKDMGMEIGFLTPRAMAKAIEMYGGDIKTDRRDATILAEVASGIPKLVKAVDEKTPERHRLTAIMSHDRELTAEVTRSANRLHALLLAVCPPLEELMAGKKIQGGLALLLLERYGGPCGLRTAGRGRAKRFVRSRKGFGGASGAKVDRVFDAISEQTLVLPGAEDLEDLIRMEARRLSSALESRKTVAKKRDAILEAIPEAEILMSMPGVGAVTCATFLAEVGDVTRFPTAARLASYAGLSPKVRQSGRSVNSVTKPRGGNRRLKRVLVLSASKSILFCDESRKYYERKRAEGRCYNSSITALARKRLDVMYAMLRDGNKYKKK